jgi:hypothetical protein
MIHRVLIGTMVVTLGVLCGTAAADVTVYNNFGPDYEGFDYNWGLGWTIAGDNNPSQYGVEQAHLVTPSDSGPLSNIWVPIWRVPFSTEPDEVTIHIAENTNDAHPLAADIMESWTLDTFPSWTDWAPPHQLESVLGPQLDAGSTYWIWMEATVDTTWCGWAHNPDPALTLPHTLRREGEDWLSLGNSTAGALRIDIVPEPATGFVLLIGGLLAGRRRWA